MLTALIARAVLALPGQRIPEWTAHVGQRWDTIDVAPWNLYNVIWRIGQWAHRKANDLV